MTTKEEAFVADFMPIPGWEGIYEAGIDGMIYSVERVVERRSRGPMRIRRRRLNPATTEFGYLSVSLFRNGKGKTLSVHRLVCMAFNGCSKYPEVNHINGNKKDNRPINLEWVSRTENMIHSYATTGRKPAQLGKRGLCRTSIKVVGTNRTTGEKIRLVSIGSGKDYGFEPSNIQKALRGEIRHHKNHTWEYDNE